MEPDRDNTTAMQFSAELYRRALADARRYVRHVWDCKTSLADVAKPDIVAECTCGLVKLTPIFDRAADDGKPKEGEAM